MILKFRFIMAFLAVVSLTACSTEQFKRPTSYFTSPVQNNAKQDSSIQKTLEMKFNVNPILRNEKIQINVLDGDVLLLGVVKSPREKRAAVNEVESTNYVRNIYNKIIIDANYSYKTYLNDAIIANLIRSRIIASDKTYLRKVDVEVFNNVVYVFGEVNTDEEKYYAENIARTGKGVLTVFSFIRVLRQF